MTTHAPRRCPSTPAYYLGRPAAFWLDALAPQRAGADGETPPSAQLRRTTRVAPAAQNLRQAADQ
jgi:hypothetical protein